MSKYKAFLIAILISIFGSATKVMAQVQPSDPPEVEFAIPFDLASLVAGVLALAVTVLLLIAGPKISLQFGKRALRMAGNIFR